MYQQSRLVAGQKTHHSRPSPSGDQLIPIGRGFRQSLKSTRKCMSNWRNKNSTRKKWWQGTAASHANLLLNPPTSNSLHIIEVISIATSRGRLGARHHLARSAEKVVNEIMVAEEAESSRLAEGSRNRTPRHQTQQDIILLYRTLQNSLNHHNLALSPQKQNIPQLRVYHKMLKCAGGYRRHSRYSPRSNRSSLGNLSMNSKHKLTCDKLRL